MAVFTPYHPALNELLDREPREGEGHRLLFKVALHMRHYHTAAACRDALRVWSRAWPGREVPDDEIEKAVAKAYSATDAEPEESRARWHWPDPRQDLIDATAAAFPPLTLQDTGITAEAFLAAVYRPDDLVCAGAANNAGDTTTLQELLAVGPSCLQFVVPNPMSAKRGTTRTGGISYRCLANTGPRRFLVAEFDGETEDRQARILCRLSNTMPLVAVVHSGGRSLHGWFWAEGLPEVCCRLWFAGAVGLGADAHTWTPCQWVRMPGGTRAGEPPRRQAVLYWNPEAAKESA